MDSLLTLAHQYGHAVYDAAVLLVAVLLAVIVVFQRLGLADAAAAADYYGERARYHKEQAEQARARVHEAVKGAWHQGYEDAMRLITVPARFEYIPNAAPPPYRDSDTGPYHLG